MSYEFTTKNKDRDNTTKPYTQTEVCGYHIKNRDKNKK